MGMQYMHTCMYYIYILLKVLRLDMHIEICGNNINIIKLIKLVIRNIY